MILNYALFINVSNPNFTPSLRNSTRDVLKQDDTNRGEWGEEEKRGTRDWLIFKI